MNNTGLNCMRPLIHRFFFSIVNTAVLHIQGWLNPGCRALVMEETRIWGPTTSYTRIFHCSRIQAPNPGIAHGSTVFTCFFIHHNKLDNRNHVLCRATSLAQVLSVFSHLLDNYLLNASYGLSIVLSTGIEVNKKGPAFGGRFILRREMITATKCIVQC